MRRYHAGQRWRGSPPPPRFSRTTEGLTGATTRPNRSVCRPSGESKGVTPPADACEEVALAVFSEVGGLYIDNGSCIDVSCGNLPRLNEFAQPRSGFRVVLVVIIHGTASKKPHAPRTTNTTTGVTTKANTTTSRNRGGTVAGRSVWFMVADPQSTPCSIPRRIDRMRCRHRSKRRGWIHCPRHRPWVWPWVRWVRCWVHDVA